MGYPSLYVMTQAVSYKVYFKGLPDAGNDEETNLMLEEIEKAIKKLPYLQDFELEDFLDE